LFSVAAVVTFVGSTFLNGLALAATPDTELGKAYEWAHSKGITTMDTYEAANMDKPITRAQMAKMLSVYAMSELGMKPDTTKTECNEFNDIANITGDLHEYIITSCQLGLMGQQIFSGIKEFRPNANISRAEFGTALSRTLWGGKYEGGTPYYANHLQALQSAGIMKIIANAETTQEIRGYVMLMLMRSAEGSEAKPDCEDPMIKAACLIEDASCPAACKESSSDEKEDTVVKAGDLAISAKSSSSRRVIIDGISDMDTINLKTSDDKITLNKVTLERYGYSSTNDVANVWLENSNGTAITEPKALNSKDSVTLNIKKDYRELSSNDVFTIVVETNETDWTRKQGSTIGFKITNVESSAANVDNPDYTPYTYDMVTYEGGTVTVDKKWKDTTYHFDSKESYEVAKIKIKGTNTTALVNGFVLTNEGDLDLKDWLDDVKVTVDGKSVKSTWSLDKEELTISFDDVEIAQKTSSVFAVSVSLADDFDDFGDAINFQIAKWSDLKATEKKTGARVTVDPDAVIDLYTYAFNGSKITLTNTKLGTVEAVAGTSDVIVWEGTIELGGQEVTFNNFYIGATAWIEAMRLAIGSDEFEGKAADVAECNGADTCWKFAVSTEESGKVKFIADVDDDAVANITFNFNDGAASTFGKNILKDGDDHLWKYEGGKYITTDDFVGSISLNTLKVQPAKWMLENNLTTKSAEFKRWESTKAKTIFDGTYTAKKQDLYLNTYSLTQANAFGAETEITFHLYIDGDEVDADTISEGEDTLEGTFSDVKVEAGKSVKVKVTAEWYAGEADANNYTFELELSWDNSDGEEGQGVASDDCIKIELVGSSSMTITSASANTVLLQKDGAVDLASFIIKPSNSDDDSEADLDEMTFTINGGVAIEPSDIKVKIGKSSTYTVEVDGGVYSVEDLDETLDSAGTDVVISVKGLDADEYELELVTPKTKTFSKYIVPALVTVKSQKDLDGSTQYVLSVEKYDSSYEVSNIDFDGRVLTASEFNDGDDFELENDDANGKTILIQTVTYEVTDGDGNPLPDVVIPKGTYNDYFKVSGSYLRIFKVD